MDPFIKNYENTSIDTKIINNLQDFMRMKIKLKENLKIFHMNIRSISKNLNELSIFLNQFSEQFDIIILSESWRIYDTSIYNLDNYDLLYNDSSINQNDGVVIYIKSSFIYTHSVVQIGGVKAIKLNISLLNKKIVITSIYKSPIICQKMFTTELLNYLEKVEKCDVHVIAGDMNINILSSNENSQEYLNVLSSQEYISYINKPTRVQGNTQTCIDHFFTKSNINGKNFTPIIYEADITDHYPIMLFMKLDKKITPNGNNEQCKQYINYFKLRTDLKQENWDELYKSNNIDTMTNIFLEKLKNNMTKNTKQINTKNKGKKKSEWITPGVINSVNKKHEMYKKAKKEPNNKNLQMEYKAYRNKLTQIIKQSKKQYFNSLINKNKNSSQNIWNTVNKIKKKDDVKIEITEIKTESGTISNKLEIANKFNLHYSTLGEKYANKILLPTDYHEDSEILEHSMYLFPTNATEIIKIINQLKLKKAPGHDGIRAETLKEVSREISEPLAFLFNKCIEIGYFPKAFKIGIIKPLYKGGDRTELVNYRPISLISSVAKIFEKILKFRMMSYIKKFKIISDRQFGFMQGRSTEDAISYLTSFIYEALDETQPCLGIYIDLAKAFDTVCHTKLLNKLKNCGIRGNVLNLLKSYLTDRVQYVNIDNYISSANNVKYGVPQGTVLGPILFTLYINNLLLLKVEGTIISFADDTVILYKSDTWQNLKNKAENDFKNIKKWFDYNLLTINYNKTNYLPFTSYSNHLPNLGPLKVEESIEIPEVTSVKYLGIIIDRHLRWDVHVNNLTKKLRGLISTFKCLKNYLDVSHLKIIYYALVQSLLSYGIIGWGGVNESHLKQLNTVQKWILRIIFSKSITYPSDLLYEESQLFDAKQLFYLKISLKTFKNKTNIKQIKHNYDTRTKQNSCLEPRSIKTAGQKSYTYLESRVYNSLPLTLRNIDGYYIFKNTLKKWILDTCRSDIHDIVNQNILT